MSEPSHPFTDQNLGPADPAKRAIGCRTIALGCLGTLVVVLVLGGGGIWLYLRQQHQQALRDVQAEVDRIHAAGEPITPEDMFAFHQVPSGTKDTTKLWQRAFELVEKSQDEDAKLLPIIGEEDVDWLRLRTDHPESLAPIAERFFQNHDDAIDAILEAAQAEGEARLPVDFSKGVAAEVPHVYGLRDLAEFLSLRSRFALARQDTVTAWESIEAILAVASTLEDHAGIVEQLTRVLVLGMYCQELQAILSEAEVSGSELSQAQQRLREIDLRNCMRLAMLGDRAAGFHAFHHMSVLDGISKRYAQKFDGVLARPVDCRYYLSLMREVIDAAEEPLLKGRQCAHAIVGQVEQTRSSKNPFERLPVVVTAELVAPLHFVFNGYANAEVRRESAIAGIAFRQYQLKYGKPPESLEALVPEFLEVVPQDPFEPETPLRFVIEDGQFAIYSIGWNLTDDRALFSDRAAIDDAGFIASLAVAGMPTPPNGPSADSQAEAVP